MQITRIKNDINGNSRRVVHFLECLTPADVAATSTSLKPVSAMYTLALKKARRLGGKRYHTRGYGGGIVFQSYSDADTEDTVRRILASE